MYRTVARLTIIPGHEKEVLEAAQELVESVKEREPDTLIYLVHSPNVANELNNPKPSNSELWTYEVYRNKDAFRAHMTGPSFLGFMARCGDKFVQARDGDKSIPYILATELALESGFIRPE